MYLQNWTVVSESNQNLGFSELIAGCLAITEFRIIVFVAVANKSKFAYVTVRKVRYSELAAVLVLLSVQVNCVVMTVRSELWSFCASSFF